LIHSVLPGPGWSSSSKLASTSSPRTAKAVAGDGNRIFEHACKLRLEGIVSKRLDMPYRPGPSKSWLKIKNPKHPAMMRIQEAFARERMA
jgi:ATP-dependent DNA ligase